MALVGQIAGSWNRHSGQRVFDPSAYGADADTNIMAWTFGQRIMEMNAARAPQSPKFPMAIRAAIAAAAADYIAEIIQAARVKPSLLRRSKRSVPILYATPAPPATTSPAATSILRAAYRRMQRPRGRRMLDFDAQDVAVNRTARRAPRTVQRRAGRRWDVPLTQVVVTVTQWPPTFLRGKRIRTALTRRGKVAALPLAQGGGSGVTSPRKLRTPSPRRSRRFEATPVQASTPSFSARRTRWASPRRGRRSDPFWAQAIVVVSQWLPPHVARRQRYGFARRGSRFHPPWTGSPLNAFVWLPKQLPRRLRVMSLLPRRGKRADAPITQAAPVAPVWVAPVRQRRARLLLLVRRARRAPLTLAQSIPVRKASPTRVYARKTSRGRRWDVIRVTVFVPISAWFPRHISSRRVYGLLKRGRRPLSVIRHLVVFAQIRTGRTEHGDQGSIEQESRTGIEQGSEGDILP